MLRPKPEDLREMLDACLEIESGLTTWEMDFIESLDNQLPHISPKQEDILKRIFENKA